MHRTQTGERANIRGTMRVLTRLVVVVAVLAGCGGEERDLDQELLAAAYENDVATAQRLVEEGADVNVKDDTQQSAYLIATSEVGDDPRLLDLTLDAGADVNAKDSYDGTGLIRAAERGYATIVARLLETDIDVNHVNRLGWTALLEAVILGEGGREHIETVRLLVDAGADVDIADESGTAALAHAQRRGFTEIERILRAAQ
jgi:ankyrin repeat protein